MKVVLLIDVKELGAKGEVKEVADGYGLNYLLPKKLAALATLEMIAKFEAEALAVRRAAERDLRRAQLLAGKLDGLELDIVSRANAEGTLFAAVTEAGIAKELTKQDYPIDKSQVVLKGPIKNTGEYKVTIRFRHGLEAEILVRVHWFEGRTT